MSHPAQLDPLVGPSVAASRTAARGEAQSAPAGWQLAILALALVGLYFPILQRLVVQWYDDPNFTHGFLVPAFSLFVLWENRRRLAELPVRAAWSGLALIGFGLALLSLGIMGAELFLSRVSLLFVLAGITALLWGWNHVRVALFPLAFLLLMIPIPSILFNQITSPLQTVASITASDILPWFGVPVLREGNILKLPKMALEVAEACSGVRSLISLAALAIMYGYLADPKTPKIRVILALASVPIAVISNSLRIVGTGLIVQYWNPAKAQGFFHAFSGLLVFLVSFLLLFLLDRGLRMLVKKKATG